MSEQFKNYLFYISAILLLLSAALYITGWPVIPYVYAVASAGVAIVYLTSPYRGENIRLKRLNAQEAIAAVLLPFSSYCMFKEKNEWVIFLAISAVLQFYVAFIKGKVQEKD
ncbi:MAG: hypothetical protein FWD60_08560 [Candidatus Azobacteroides sp.]|nr:hypothetical protein [Candidatus Azobacteroides sp.]